MRLHVREPLTTPAPHPVAVANALGIRQDDLPYGDLTSLCGFFYGDAANPYTCEDYDGICVQNTVNSRRDCCTSPWTDCALPTSCVNLADYSSCEEGAGCASETLVKTCSDESYPFCYTGLFRDPGNPDFEQTRLDCHSSESQTSVMLITPTLSRNDVSTLYSGLPTNLPEDTDYDAIMAVVRSASSASEVSATADFTESGSVAFSAQVDANGFITNLNGTPLTPGADSPPTVGASGGAGTSGTSAASSDASGAGGGGLSESATIGIAVCASILGIVLIAAATFLLWKKRRNSSIKAAPTHQHSMRVSGFQSDPFHPGNFDSFNANFSKMDDDAVARMRRFSNDGTIDQTVAGRTNDDYRPLAY